MLSPSLDDTVPMVHRLEMVEVSTNVLNTALRHGSSGRLPVTAGLADDGSNDEEETCLEDGHHPLWSTQHESTRVAAPSGAGPPTLRDKVTTVSGMSRSWTA